MTGMNPRLAAAVADIFRDFERENNRRESERAKADPKAHKLTHVFEGKGATNYRFVRGGKDGRGRTVDFCWSSHRNVAGYFLTWREVTTRGRGGKRDQWAARKVRKRAQALAEQRAERFRARQAPATSDTPPSD